MGQIPEMSRGRSGNVLSVFVCVGLGGFGVLGDFFVGDGRSRTPLGNPSAELTKQGFGTADLLDAFVKPDGSAKDLGNRLPPEFDLKSELLSGIVKVITKTDCLAYNDSMKLGRTSCFYNWFSKRMIGNYANWVFAQPAKD